MNMSWIIKHRCFFVCFFMVWEYIYIVVQSRNESAGQANRSFTCHLDEMVFRGTS